MSEIKLYDDTQTYIDMFYTPKITSYEFLKSFFAELYSQNVTKISRDLSEFFYSLKNNPKYNVLLREIHFRSNGIFKYSNEIEDDILTLQNMGLLGKKNPSFGIIFIEFNTDIVAETLGALSSEFRPLIKEIANLYRSEEKKREETIANL